MKLILFIVCIIVVSLLKAQTTIDNTPKLQNAELIIDENNGDKNTMKETDIPQLTTSTNLYSDSISSPRPELINQSKIGKDDILHETVTPNIIGVKP